MRGTIPRPSHNHPVLNTDTVIVGAGIVGLAVARAVSLFRKEDVVLIDKGPVLGTETSSRNSGVIHAGLYYSPPTSLKAQFCVRGKQLAYEYFRERSIPYEQCGKLIVATSPSQLATLQTLHEQAQANGVLDTILLNKDETFQKEPSLAEKSNHNTVEAALFSPSTGIVDVHAWMEQLWDEADTNGVTTAYHSNITDAGLTYTDDGEGGERQQRIGLYIDRVWLSCRSVINCAGLWAPNLAEMIHRQQDNEGAGPSKGAWKPPRHYFAKGNYYQLDTTSLLLDDPPKFNHLVYPVPDPGGLGTHATMDLQGKIRFGPDVEWIDPEVTDPDSIDLDVPTECRPEFLESIRKYWRRDLPREALVPDYAGLRPKLSHPSLPGHDASSQDFVIAGPETHGIEGLVHLFGIESPGLTSSMAIAEHVAGMVRRRDEEAA